MVIFNSYVKLPEGRSPFFVQKESTTFLQTHPIQAKDVINNEPLTVGQAVRFHLYEDRAGLGAEQCYAIA